MARDGLDKSKLADKTKLVLGGRDKHFTGEYVNPPLVRASTVLFEDAAGVTGKKEARYSYGLNATHTIEALEGFINDLENGAGTVLQPSGLNAVTLALMAATSSGDRLLMPDNVYGPSRRFCDQTLARMGVEIVYYDPLIGADISELFATTGNTALLMEAPGSHTFEMPNIPVMIEAAKAAGVVTLIDNTWATPLIFKPLDHGFDYSIQAGTKYFSGHSDLLIGSISANEKHWPRLKETHLNFGVQAGTEEMYLTMRGLRTMALRIDHQEKSALRIAKWLQDHDAVDRVLHPALPEDPGHVIWKEIMGRSTGLFAFVLKGNSLKAAETFLDTVDLFGLGYSWGGYESLAVLSNSSIRRTTSDSWRPDMQTIRLSIGLEESDDLIADLEQALDKAMQHI